MSISKKSESERISVIFPYLMGCLTVATVFLLLCLFVGYRIGRKDISNLYLKVFPVVHYKQLLFLPEDVLEELTELNAVIGNAGNPTNQPEHNTLAAIPDDELTYVLRKDTKMFVSVLRTTKAYNFDPPVLVLKYADIDVISARLKSYLRDQSRLIYSYSTDHKGFRRTFPYIDSNEQVLIIGDSVAFGVGVDDELTAASYLQQMVSKRYEIVNAGVGGYDGQQAFLIAKKLSKKTKFAGLIYVACQNDFRTREDWIQEANDVLAKIKSISERFNNNIIVMLHTYMEYNLRDIFLQNGWTDKRIQKTHELRRALPRISKKYGYEYSDWTEIVDEFMIRESSILSRFALYADHCHLSPLGNRLMAEKLLKIMEYKWQGKT
ncbi:MAG: SGNH/GDSL hydrolase family protein [Syntrophobacterales bacterium]|jgi:lysophospholipase L1-like esterase